MSAGVHLGRHAMGLGSRMVTVRRMTGTHIAGEWVVGGDSDTKRRLQIHKISPSDRKLLPESVRVEDSIRITANNPLRIEANHVEGAAGPDRVLHDGYWWKVVGETSWAPVGFLRYVGVREGKWREKP